jgi:eukaryotic-like serine/threonine-protein kinase
MSPGTSTTNEPLSEDSALALALDQLLEQSRGGRMPDLDSMIRRFPEHASELRELCATMLIAEDFGSFAGQWHELLDQPTQAGSSASGLTAAATQFPMIWGQYELLEELGRGGMGVVYRARQLTLNRIVALKRVSRADLASEQSLARFRAEAEAAARVVHPNIVPIYEVGEHAGQPYFSMKLVEGSTLSRRLQDGPLTSRAAAELMIPICRAMSDAHRQGLLHRDLKPSNILLDREGTPYISDFGLAKQFIKLPSQSPSGNQAGSKSIGDTAGDQVADKSGLWSSPQDESQAGSLTQSGAILGTPGYMAPEQAAGQRGELGPATDVYALGAILYAALTGRPPFQASTAFDTILMVLEQEPIPPRYLNPKVDPDLEMIALKCLQKPSDLRYRSADELANDLRAYLSNEPIAARSSHLSQILVRALRETHHAPVLENWGLLWMWHSLVVLTLCVITNVMQWQGIDDRWPYVALWSIGVGTWASIFWELRRRAGPITFVERQIAHVWAGSSIASTLLFALEWLLDLPVLTLSAALPLIAGNVFLVKAGILSGKFYLQAVALFATSVIMAALHQTPDLDVGLTLFGVVIGLCFFLPGWKYWNQRRQAAFAQS